MSRGTILQTVGLEKLKARAPVWLAIMTEAKRLGPKCTHILRSTGSRCGNTPLRGSDICWRHLKGAERDQLDIKRVLRAKKLQNSTNARHQKNAASVQRVAERRQLHRMWKVDATIPGSTLILDPQDEKQIRDWLSGRHAIDLDNYTHASGHKLSARAIDRLRWGACLSLTGRLTEEAGRRRVVVALRDDLKFYTKAGLEP